MRSRWPPPARGIAGSPGCWIARRGRSVDGCAAPGRGRRACACARSDTRYALDPGELTAVTPAGSELGDAVEAIMLAVRARVLRFGPLKTHRIGHGSWRCASPAGCSGAGHHSRRKSSGMVVRQHDLIATQPRTATAGQAPQPRPPARRQRRPALDASRRRSYPGRRASAVTTWSTVLDPLNVSTFER
jgi:hypothetical protein